MVLSAVEYQKNFAIFINGNSISSSKTDTNWHFYNLRLSLQSEKYEIMWTSKILIFRFFSKLENARKYILGLFSEAATGGVLQKRVFLEISQN